MNSKRWYPFVNNKAYKYAMPYLLLFTGIMFLVANLLPERHLELFPNAAYPPGLYGFIDPQTGQSSYWIDQESHEWACNYKPEHYYGCGITVGWYEAMNNKGIDFRKFDFIDIEMDYQGPNDRVRLMLRNNNAAYSQEGDENTSKHMHMLFSTKELKNKIISVKPEEFIVSKWWINQYGIHRRWSTLELNNIVAFGVEIVEHGESKIKLKKVKLRGPWVKNETLTYITLVLWMMLFLTQGLLQFYFAYRLSQLGRQRINELLNEQKNLETEKKYLDNISKLDPLTGIYNRNAFLSCIEKLIFKENNEFNFIVFFDLDHFKKVNDNYGHDFGDEVLKAFATSISHNIRKRDIFARWGGEEFILICNVSAIDSLKSLVEKLRLIVNDIRIDSKPKFSFSVSIGVSLFKSKQSFEEAFRCADKALYRAKANGRNKVEYEI